MRALVWKGDDVLEVDELPDPEPGEGEVVLDVEIAGICGSDLHAYRGHPGPRRPPLVLGHEAIGTVAGRGGRYAVFPLVVCGRCAACTRGEENLCENRGLLGLGQLDLRDELRIHFGMMRRRRGVLGECEARTQGALVFENTGATEDADSRRPARPGGTRPHSERSS